MVTCHRTGAGGDGDGVGVAGWSTPVAGVGGDPVADGGPEHAAVVNSTTRASVRITWRIGVRGPSVDGQDVTS
jgi:hypothetical protein